MILSGMLVLIKEKKRKIYIHGILRHKIVMDNSAIVVSSLFPASGTFIAC